MVPQFCVGDAGLKELDVNQSINLYPNPVSSILTLSSKDVNMESIEIMTITGQSVYTKLAKSDFITLDVSSFTKGLYLVKILTDNGVSLKQLIIQ